MDSQIDNIIIDGRFRLMILPLVKERYLRLEADIVRNGCRDPVKLWQGILVDGLNRIRICKNHKLQYQTEELVFNDRDEVIAYIASIQLLRSDVPEETRRYLIGKRFEAEKAVAHRQKISDWNLYTRNADIHGLAYRVFNPAQLPRPNQSIRTPAAFRLANEYCVSADTIDKYGRCAKAIDIIAEKDIALAKMLISGKYRIAQSVIVAIAKRTPQEMEKIRKNIAAEEPLGEGMRSRLKGRTPPKVSRPPTYEPPARRVSVKDKPQRDPDAEINRLSLTLPTWTGSIERAYDVSDMNEVSDEALDRLEKVLSKHYKTVTEMLSVIRRDDDGAGE